MIVDFTQIKQNVDGNLITLKYAVNLSFLVYNKLGIFN